MTLIIIVLMTHIMSIVRDKMRDHKRSHPKKQTTHRLPGASWGFHNSTMAFLITNRLQSLSSINALLSIKAHLIVVSSSCLEASASQILSHSDNDEPHHSLCHQEDRTDTPLLTMIPKNLNVYWVVASSVAIWFLFIHAPPLLISRKVFQDAAMSTHMAGAYTIYLACVFNTMLTPSTLHGNARPWHVWVGRIGMVAGIISFILGLYCAWWPYREIIPPLGFSIGITFGGIMQILSQKNGYRAICKFKRLKLEVEEMERGGKKGEELETLKDEKEVALRSHIYNMVALFVAACGIPAGIRIADMLPEIMGPLRVGGVIALTQWAIKPYGDTFIAKPTKVN